MAHLLKRLETVINELEQTPFLKSLIDKNVILNLSESELQTGIETYGWILTLFKFRKIVMDLKIQDRFDLVFCADGMVHVSDCNMCHPDNTKSIDGPCHCHTIAIHDPEYYLRKEYGIERGKENSSLKKLLIDYRKVSSMEEARNMWLNYYRQKRSQDIISGNYKKIT